MELPDPQIGVVVNTAEDLWISGNHLSPDIDTVMYLFSGDLNTDTWWGMKDDTFATHEEAKKLGVEEFIRIGDRDRAVHIARGELLRRGLSLSGATEQLCRAMGIGARIFPMSDAEVRTLIRSGTTTMHFQEYWVKNRGNVPVDEVIRSPASPVDAGDPALTLIGESSAVVIGPSNPITSILPILECRGVRELLEERFVVAVSPFIGDAPVSGPAGELMKARGFEPNSRAVHGIYDPLVDLFVQDIRDPVTVPGALRFDTLMTGPEKSRDLARFILNEIRSRGMAV
ncbi:LPPG:FO 2-phospho-L-lactate transferase [Methanolinea mesophila]|nr:LPPG:FO 2-phospho-L-lactate transferase [Methanolinea mesophila]